MRAWRLADGRRLVEETEGTFVLRTADGRPEREFRPWQGSESEHLYTTTYAVVDGELRCRFTDDNWDSAAPATVRDSVELTGLTPEPL